MNSTDLLLLFCYVLLLINNNSCLTLNTTKIEQQVYSVNNSDETCFLNEELALHGRISRSELILQNSFLVACRRLPNMNERLTYYNAIKSAHPHTSFLIIDNSGYVL